MKKKKTSSSLRWLSEHFNDIYVKHAHSNNFRSRSWFKIHEIDAKYNIFKYGMNVIDLGSAPGSWSQYAIKKIGKKGSITACDIQLMKNIPGVCFLQGDISKKETLKNLFYRIGNKKIHLIMSDMSPNITGISDIDIPRSFNLSNLAFNISMDILSIKGIFLIKLFQGTEFKNYLKKMRFFFNIVKIYKPRSSRNRSREVFVIAIGKKYGICNKISSINFQ